MCVCTCIKYLVLPTLLWLTATVMLISGDSFRLFDLTLVF